MPPVTAPRRACDVAPTDDEEPFQWYIGSEDPNTPTSYNDQTSKFYGANYFCPSDIPKAYWKGEDEGHTQCAPRSARCFRC